MKILSTTFWFVTIFLITFSDLDTQIPNAIPFQGAARDSTGLPIINAGIAIRFSILDSNISGNVIYSESQSTTTSGLGLFTVNIGEGTVISGSFDSIRWDRYSKFLMVEIDPNADILL